MQVSVSSFTHSPNLYWRRRSIEQSLHRGNLIHSSNQPTNQPLFQRKRLTGSGNPSFKVVQREKLSRVGRGDNRAVTELGFAHVTTKTWAYSGVFGFFRKKCRQKNCPPHQNHFLKIQWEIHFLERHFLRRNAPKLIIQHFIKKLLLDLIPDLGKCPNQKIRKCANTRMK